MSPDRGTLTVLIVDDHPSFRAVARMMLETDGFAVVGTEEDGESGVAGTLRLEPDIVLLDVELPDIDGFEVAARLRAAGSRAAIVLASSRDRADFGSLGGRVRRARVPHEGRPQRRRHPQARRVTGGTVILDRP